VLVVPARVDLVEGLQGVGVDRELHGRQQHFIQRQLALHEWQGYHLVPQLLVADVAGVEAEEEDGNAALVDAVHRREVHLTRIVLLQGDEVERENGDHHGQEVVGVLAAAEYPLQHGRVDHGHDGVATMVKQHAHGRGGASAPGLLAVAVVKHDVDHVADADNVAHLSRDLTLVLGPIHYIEVKAGQHVHHQRHQRYQIRCYVGRDALDDGSAQTVEDVVVEYGVVVAHVLVIQHQGLLPFLHERSIST